MDSKKTEKVQVKELASLIQIIQEKGLYSISLYTELNDMNANPTLWYLKEDTAFIDVDMQKLLLFKIKYGLM
jgi:hypothetical protein